MTPQYLWSAMPQTERRLFLFKINKPVSLATHEWDQLPRDVQALYETHNSTKEGN